MPANDETEVMRDRIKHKFDEIMDEIKDHNQLEKMMEMLHSFKMPSPAEAAAAEASDSQHETQSVRMKETKTENAEGITDVSSVQREGEDAKLGIPMEENMQPDSEEFSAVSVRQVILK